MALSKGATVFVEGWNTTNGTYVKECIIESISSAQVTLREIKTHYADGREVPSDGSRVKLDYAYLEIPIEKRLQKQREEIQWLIDQFTK